MTQDEVIAMAREAGFRTGNITTSSGEQTPFIAPISATHCLPEVLRFAALVAAAEREACAQVCESFKQGNSATYIDDDWADMCAQAIRARVKS
jgi:hypothetical protein